MYGVEARLPWFGEKSGSGRSLPVTALSISLLNRENTGKIRAFDQIVAQQRARNPFLVGLSSPIPYAKYQGIFGGIMGREPAKQGK
jgi:hypothetical protein